MITTEGMGRRACKDGDEVDYLPRTRDRKHQIENHGVHAKIKTAHNRRSRRQVRAGLRNSQEG